jgi:hypothetical protein
MPRLISVIALTGKHTVHLNWAREDSSGRELTQIERLIEEHLAELLEAWHEHLG